MPEGALDRKQCRGCKSAATATDRQFLRAFLFDQAAPRCASSRRLHESAIQDEKSQHKNKAKALSVLRSRLYERQQAKQREADSAARRSMVGGGDRSEKIRTYNFPQDRLTDHRIGLTLYNLDRVMDGDLGEMISNV